MSRLDAFLKNVGLFSARSQAKIACDNGHVTISGVVAKPSRRPLKGEILTLDLDEVHIKAEIVDIPSRSVPKGRRSNFIRIVNKHRRQRYEMLGFDDDE